MKKNAESNGSRKKVHPIIKLIIAMKCTILFVVFIGLNSSFASLYAQQTKLDINVEDCSLRDLFKLIESQSEFSFMYDNSMIDVEKTVTINVKKSTIDQILYQVLSREEVKYKIIDRHIVLLPVNNPEEKEITGKVRSAGDGEPLPGVNVVVKGTSVGTVTDLDGEYTISVENDDAVLIFSSVGFLSREVAVGNLSVIDVVLSEDITALEEVVVVGYGTQKKIDLTGSVVRADIESFSKQPNLSIAESLQGSVAGLNVGQVNQAGAEPAITIRGQTSISGAQNPLIVLDGVIYRGSIIDINPSDIESVDVLKDNSAAAVYGSQAANGVILITTKSGQKAIGKPVISYSGNFAMEQPSRELGVMDPDEWLENMIAFDYLNSRTAESGYLEPVPDYPPITNFKDSEQVNNFEDGNATDWDDVVTNDFMYTQMHTLGLTSRTESVNYFISVGFADQKGYIVNEDYQRYNIRLNADNQIKNWLNVGVQTFYTWSDYSGASPSPGARFNPPYVPAYRENGELNYPNSAYNSNLTMLERDNLDTRSNLFANIYAKIDIPFIKGLSFKPNLANTMINNRDYYFDSYINNGLGDAGKIHTNHHILLSDYILHYKNTFVDKHQVDVTLLYGFEKAKYDYTKAGATQFASDALSYNRLQAGEASLQSANSDAWEEASIWSMARLSYSFDNRYLLTATVRRDGFSGFSKNNKFGVFPSASVGWVMSSESFMSGANFIDFLKLRAAYGTAGNRTLGRYQTLARVTDGYNYVTDNDESLYTTYISSLASNDLKWETTTGLNVGLDFEVLNSRLSGTIEYYNNNTNNLLYDVDVPYIGRFPKFPDNLGEIHNHGLEITLNSRNIDMGDFSWSSGFVFSRNRDELRELLGYDNDGDGVEDDLVSEGLFIGEPLNVIYDYEITGKIYQLGDELPTWADVGSYEIVDQNGDGELDILNDYTILGYRDPSYRFSISNTLRYKNFSLFFFINSVQGGKNYYYQLEDFESQARGGWNGFGSNNHYNYNFPTNLDVWLPENPGARYQRMGANATRSAWRPTQRNFVRLQDISLSYRFGNTFLDRSGIRNFEIFLAGKNLGTWSKWVGLDPETGTGMIRDGRPVMRSYAIGLNIEF